MRQRVIEKGFSGIIAMNQITSKVRRAQTRLNLHRFVHTLLVSLFVALVIAAIGLAIPKFRPVAIDARTWMWGWLAGATVIGILAASLITYIKRSTPMEAAIEIDRRFGLKERVSSTLALTSEDRETDIGQALVADAVRRAERVDVSEKFTFKRRWWNLLPILPALCIAFILTLSDAAPPQEAKAAQLDSKKIQRSTQELKKRIAQRRAKAKDENLKEASDLFDKLEKGVEQLQAKPMDRKKALVKLNDLKQEIQKRKSSLGNQEELQKRLNQMSDLKQGPAKKLAKAMKSGQFDKAIKELKDLQAKMQSGELTKAEQEKLASQMSEMADALKSMADSHEAAKQELKRQIAEQQKAGNMANAGELQRKLDKMSKQDNMMQQLSQMAQKMKQGAQKSGEGDMKGAAQQLADISENLEALEDQLEEMEMLDGALDQLASAKDAMNCDT